MLNPALSSRNSMLLAALALLVSGWLAAFGITLWRLHDRALADGFTTARMHARNIEDSLTKTLQVIDLSADSLPSEPQALATHLTGLLRPSPFLRSLSLLNPTGQVLVSSNHDNLGVLIDTHDFYPEADLDWRQLRIGLPWQGRDLATGTPSSGAPASHDAASFIPVMRRIDFDDQPAWWLAALNPDDFINHFIQLLPSETGRIQLLRYDSALLLSSQRDDVPSRLDQAGEVPARLAQQDFGEFEQHLPDGTAVLTAYRASSLFPVVIAVHLDRRAVLDPWRAEVRGLSLIVVPILAALSIAMLLFWRRRRRLAQQHAELARQRRLTSSVFDASTDAIMLTTPSGEMLSVNPAFERQTGYASAQALGCNPRLLASGQHDAAFYRELWDALLRDGYWQGEIVNRRQDGSLYPALLTINAVRDVDGQLLHYVGVMADMTERKRYEADLLIAKERAESAVIAKTTFLATMSHELRTPMNGILGMTGILLRSELTDTQRRHLGIVKTSADSLLAILADILDYARIEAHGIHFKPEPFAPADLIDSILALFTSQAESKALALHTELDALPPGPVIADPLRVRQILTNLISNAIKFTPSGTIVVRAWREPIATADAGTMLVMSVTDSGIGIDSTLHDTIFEPFVQADGSDSRHYGGTGLGLAISRRLAAAMGGTLRVASTPGQGSCFTLRIRVQT